MPLLYSPIVVAVLTLLNQGNLIHVTIIRNVKTIPGGAIFNRTRQFLAYADDVVILGQTDRYISENLLNVLVHW
jgi:hypothetical protein